MEQTKLAVGRRPQAAPDRVYAVLVEWIRQGDWPAGRRVVETELSRRLGVSATPVREALRRLEADGVLVREPHSGMRVRTWTYEDAEALYEARQTLEGKVAELAAWRATPSELDHLASLMAAQERALDCNDRREAQRLDTDIHLAMGRYARSSVLEQLLDKVWLLVPVLRATIWERDDLTYLDHMIGDHELLLHCLRNRSPRAAREAAEHHVRRAWERIRKANRLEPPPSSDRRPPDPSSTDADPL
ncbi:MAG: GntR family transcriptional regulator [Actinomycetia bacterium]|nr:GntR family transcriptional regulator [Actinomycetes bacterium]